MKTVEELTAYMRSRDTVTVPAMQKDLGLSYVEAKDLAVKYGAFGALEYVGGITYKVKKPDNFRFGPELVFGGELSEEQKKKNLMYMSAIADTMAAGTVSTKDLVGKFGCGLTQAIELRKWLVRTGVIDDSTGLCRMTELEFKYRFGDGEEASVATEEKGEAEESDEFPPSIYDDALDVGPELFGDDDDDEDDGVKDTATKTEEQRRELMQKFHRVAAETPDDDDGDTGPRFSPGDFIDSREPGRKLKISDFVDDDDDGGMGKMPLIRSLCSALELIEGRDEGTLNLSDAEKFEFARTPDGEYLYCMTKKLGVSKTGAATALKDFKGAVYEDGRIKVKTDGNVAIALFRLFAAAEHVRRVYKKPKSKPKK